MPSQEVGMGWFPVGTWEGGVRRLDGRSRRRDGGQVAVEAALVLPLLVLVALGLLQLTLLHQARLTVQYAAFQAARAGSVWNGSREKMESAALVSLLPTLGRADGLSALVRTRERALDLSASLASVPGLFGLLRVENVSGAFPASSAEWRELDFDAPGTEGEEPSGGEEGPVRAETSVDAAYREATVLQVRLRFLYELRIPFVNAVLFSAWRALRGRGQAGEGDSEGRALAALASERRALVAGEREGRHYFLPLTATYRMRLQSNLYRKWAGRASP